MACTVHGADGVAGAREHDLLRDFVDEVPGDLSNARLCAALEALELEPGVAHMPDNLRRCCQQLVELQLVGAEELPLVDAWLHDYARVGEGNA